MNFFKHDNVFDIPPAKYPNFSIDMFFPGIRQKKTILIIFLASFSFFLNFYLIIFYRFYGKILLNIAKYRFFIKI